ncbi:putative epoxide hydrolase [Aspergillus lentulus]|uniref:Epoxide hydrolase n=2 Tax=Aspergillus lentulus TaxID=293939 RepID=A0AAN4PP11_ASPLE|nr:putative epoxide hydrolase [Aspergillus lentulus]
MIEFCFQLLAASCMHIVVHAASRANDPFNVRPFHIELSARIPRMLDQIQNTRLPEWFPYSGVDSSFGIDLDVLKALRREWVTDFNWKTEQDSMNQFNHYKTPIENLSIHFVYEKSPAPNAIPLLLVHGWPGSFLEFAPIIDQLTKEATTSTGKTVSFDVIIPSLPGFAFSSPPPPSWTITDTARILNTLMVDVLGYETYAIHGTDWGSAVSYNMYDTFNATIGAAHFVFLPFYPQTPGELTAGNITLSKAEQAEEQNAMNWANTGDGYFIEQSTKSNTVGLALHDNPVGQLAWLGEKFMNWSDPNAGTGPSVLNHNEILRSVSLYYLTGTFASSVLIYSQNPNTWKTEYSKARNDAPLLFSSFKYNVGFWPARLVSKLGNLVLYRNHDFGGHFPGLDNPPALLEDLREIGSFWSR